MPVWRWHPQRGVAAPRTRERRTAVASVEPRWNHHLMLNQRRGADSRPNDAHATGPGQPRPATARRRPRAGGHPPEDARAAQDLDIEVRPATALEDLAIMLGPKRPDATVCW